MNEVCDAATESSNACDETACSIKFGIRVVDAMLYELECRRMPMA